MMMRVQQLKLLVGLARIKFDDEIITRPTVVLRCRWEREKDHHVWVVPNGTSNIFWVGKPKKLNYLKRAFWTRQGQRRLPSEGGGFEMYLWYVIWNYTKSVILWKNNSKFKIHILPNYEQTDLKTAIVIFGWKVEWLK